MKDPANIHLKVQELCDCFATTDPLLEMSRIKHEKDLENAPLKYLALILLHCINDNADTVSLKERQDGSLDVIAKYRPASLPEPGPALGRNIIEAIFEMTQLDSTTTTTPFAFGFRNNSLELQVDAREEEGAKVITFHFPEA